MPETTLDRPETREECPHLRPWAELGGKLRVLREGRQLSNRELASRAQVAASRISTVEQGRVRPSREYLIRIAPVLGVEASRLEGWAGYRKSGATGMPLNFLDQFRNYLLNEGVDPTLVTTLVQLVQWALTAARGRQTG